MIRSKAPRLLKGGAARALAAAALFMVIAPGRVPAADNAPAPVVNWSDPAKTDDAKTAKTDAAPAKDATAATDKSVKTDKAKTEKAAPAAEAPAPATDKTEKADKHAKAGKEDKADKKSATLPKARVIGKFDVWEAAYFDDHGNKVCYMATEPVSTSSSSPVHGRDKNVMLFITHWPADNEKNAVTISSGYSYKEGTKAIVNIGTESFALDTGGPGTGADADMSWMKDDSQDDALTTAIQKGEELTVRGMSKRGTTITDTYSLKGSADAYKAITKTCGY